MFVIDPASYYKRQVGNLNKRTSSWKLPNPLHIVFEKPTKISCQHTLAINNNFWRDYKSTFLQMLQLELLLFIRGLIQKNYEYGYRMHKKKNVPHNLLKFYLGLKNLNMSSVRIGGEKNTPSFSLISPLYHIKCSLYLHWQVNFYSNNFCYQHCSLTSLIMVTLVMLDWVVEGYIWTAKVWVN